MKTYHCKTEGETARNQETLYQKKKREDRKNKDKTKTTRAGKYKKIQYQYKNLQDTDLQKLQIGALFMLPESRMYLLKQAEEECIEPVFALSELGQLANSNLKIEQGLCFWTFNKKRGRNKKGSTEELTEVSGKKNCCETWHLQVDQYLHPVVRFIQHFRS